MHRVSARRSRRLVVTSLGVAAFCYTIIYFAVPRLPATFGSSSLHPIWNLLRTIKSSTSCVPDLVQVHHSQDGLLYFDDNIYRDLNCTTTPITHPIISLLNNATQAWNLKLRSQSSDFPAAVAEYRRRNQRNPPMGYDNWWSWASENNVKLLDEYDTLQRSIEPFFALPPHVFRQRAEALISQKTKWAQVS